VCDLVQLFAILLALSHSIAVSAQAATPAPPPFAAATAGCTVEPRSPNELLAVIGTPDPAATMGPGPDHAIVLPPGEPADSATAAAVTATMDQFVGCLDAQDALRFTELLTDDFLRRLGRFQTEAIDPQSPQPGPPVDSGAIVRVRDVVVLADGRAGAIVWFCHLEDSHPAPGRAFYVVFAKGGDRWQVDDMSPFVDAGGKVVGAADLACEPAPICSPLDEPGVVS
jgi:hypothetical protein